MKYEFKKIDLDTTQLNYKDKSFVIKRDINLIKEMQSSVFRAKKKMYIDLAKEGITKDDLVIKRKEGNKTIEDNTNLVAIENEYTQEASMEMFDNICTKCFGKGVTELILDIGLNEEESEKFGVELMTAFTGASDELSPREFAKTLK